VALTAIATQDIFDIVVKRLSMINPYVVALSTDRPNILMQVQGSKSSTEFVNQMVSTFKEKQMTILSFAVIIKIASIYIISSYTG